MLFPIIKIKDGDSEPRMVGTNTHDCLYVDEKTRGIHYLNRQSFGSTEYEEEEIEFVPQELDDDVAEIEMVDFRELTEIYLQDSDEEIKQIMNKALEDIEKIKDKNIKYFEKAAEGLVMSGVMIDFKSRKKLDERLEFIKVMNKIFDKSTKEEADD